MENVVGVKEVGSRNQWKEGLFPNHLHCTHGSITQPLLLQSQRDFSCLSQGFLAPIPYGNLAAESALSGKEALRPNCCVTNYLDKYLALISGLITLFNQSAPHSFLLCCHPVNAPFLLELSLVKMSKFSH